MTYSNHQTIKHWAEEDRPREKLIRQGRKATTVKELLTIILGSGFKNVTAHQLAQVLLDKCDQDLHKLSVMSAPQLCQVKGIGPAKAVHIIAALELGKRAAGQDIPKKTKIQSSQEAFNSLRQELYDLSHEEFHVLFLNRSNQIIFKSKISSGGLSSTVVDARIIFRQALDHQATSIILAHNHPSGNLQPSEADKSLTQEIKKAGQLLNISVLDHLIITRSGFYSFADEGYL